MNQAQMTSVASVIKQFDVWQQEGFFADYDITIGSIPLRVSEYDFLIEFDGDAWVLVPGP